MWKWDDGGSDDVASYPDSLTSELIMNHAREVEEFKRTSAMGKMRLALSQCFPQ